MSNKICELLHIQYPIIQGGMAWVAEASLASAVSNSGGFGIITAGSAEPGWVKYQIIKAKTLTKKPFGVNVMMLSEHVAGVIDVICEEGVSAITTGAGNPGKYIDQLKKSGVKVMPVVSSVALAKRLERYGADAVIAEGCEAGGHIGELTTFVLVPEIVDAVSIPVVAAGGVADGRGAAAAFALGAVGVQVGTRFICSLECLAHDNYKQMIVNAKDRSTVVCGEYTGHPVRVLKNKLASKLRKLEEEKLSVEDFEKLGIGALYRAVVEGDVILGSVMAGQSSGMVSDILSCEDIIQELTKFLPVGGLDE